MVGEQIRVKYGQVERIREVVIRLFNQPMPVEAQYWLRRNVEAIGLATKSYEKRRLELIQTEGIKDKDSDMYRISPDNEKFKALMDEDIEVTIRPIELKMLKDVKLTQQETSAIDFMLCDEKMIKVVDNFIH